MVLKCCFQVIRKGTCPTGEVLIIRLHNGLERKKIEYCSFWEGVQVLQGEVKIT